MDIDVVEQLCSDIEIPKMVRVKQHFDATYITPEKISEVVYRELGRECIASRIKPGMSIAITCGSRGVANIDLILKAIVDYVKEKRAKPFIFPAMGSHGGATAEGQLAIVHGYGVTEATMGCPIYSSMETKQIGVTDDNRPVFIDKYAAEADGIILCGRIKAHTQFVGPYESGLMKMAVIGLGKQHGAEGVHEQGFKYMAGNIQRYGKMILRTAPIICGVGSIENAYDRPNKIVALTAAEIEEKEPQLLLEAKKKMGRILIDNADLLIVDEIGKNISGDGMDPNVSGTLPRHTGVPRGKDGSEPRISNFKAQRCIVLDLSEETHGNANGIGLADVTTQRLVDKIDNEMAYPNALTSTLLEMVNVPFYTKNDKVAIQVGIRSCNGINKKNPRIIRIKNTVEIEEIEVSEVLIPEVKNHPQLELLGKPGALVFDEKGNLF